MKVYVKENRSIPEGYTYRRCDTYTAAELIAACSLENNDGFARPGWQNPHAVAYVEKHRKAAYTVEDKLAILALTTQNADLEAALRGRRGGRRKTK